MLRFFFDEHVAEASGEQLKRCGIDVLTAKDAGRANQKIADVDQLAFAAEQERVMVTADREFIVHASARVPHFGVILLQRGYHRQVCRISGDDGAPHGRWRAA